ncbi:MAG: hypothetical protein LBR38_04635 [Synergistaceae bacterium]|jgi:hypothetical protein|nr:hypothetical protein [Synergistaceae bacterium]
MSVVFGGALFVAGMACGAVAGHLFYLDRLPAGGAMLFLTVVFLFFGLRYSRGVSKVSASRSDAGQLAKAVTALAVFSADEAMNGAKNIGRTLPCTQAELDSLEDQISAIFDELPVSSRDRARIYQDLTKLKTRFRQNEGRMALVNRKR